MPEPESAPPAGPTPPSVVPGRGRWWIGLAIVVVVTLAVGGVWALTRTGPSGDDDVAGSSRSVGAASTAVCGYEGGLVDRLVATRAVDAKAPAVRQWTVAGSADLGGIAISSTSVVVERDVDDTTSEFHRYSLAGDAEGSFTVGIQSDGRWTMADDGSLYLVDTDHGSTRSIVHLGPDGSRIGSFTVPISSETSNQASDLRSLEWLSDYKGSPALLVAEGQHTDHVLGPDGENRGLITGLPNILVGRVGTDSVAGYRNAAQGISVLDVTSLSGARSLHVVYASPDPNSDSGADAEPTTPQLGNLVGVAPGPGGDGFVIASRDGIMWVDSVGVQKAMLLSGENALSGSEPEGMVERDGHYWILIQDDDTNSQKVISLTSAQLRSELVAPILDTASNEQSEARLGLGIGAVTHVAFNQFDAGQTPQVYLRTENGWGGSAASRPDLEVLYSVRGDPTLADPVSTTTRTAAIPWGGGETALALPPTRPGPYEVSLRVVDRGSGETMAGQCLHYSVGAAGADLDLGRLSAGDDWGGAAPLRGAQLAASLGVGSHRMQLDFGSIVPDPTATPSESALQWDSLPGSGQSPDSDPWQNLREAGAYATAHHVTLIAQLGNGGDAENKAVAAGTWAGWARLIVAAFARNAPGISTWEAWNEPNGGDMSAHDYWTKVEIPFDDAAHAASASATVIAGNTLGFATDWWKQAAADGVCSHADAIGVHPYTGWNRSWEEEGFENEGSGYSALAAALGPACAALPRWDTESGWTADGAVAYWAQGSNIARKLLWYRLDRIAGWTYFFSEGGFGENGLSWSLVQYRSYVKPGGLAFAAVSRLLAGRGTPRTVDTGIPFVHAMRVPGDDSMLAVWTDEARMPARLTTDSSSATVTDEYGATSSVALSGGGADVVLTATPQFFRVAGSDAKLGIEAQEDYGKDLLKGQKVTASSTFKDADPQTVTSGTADPYQPWRSGTVNGKLDRHPSVTVSLASAATIDRVAVATGNIACCQTGLRDYIVSVQRADGSWQVVARPKAQFWERTVVFRFDPVEVTAVRVQAEWTRIRGVKMLDVNYTGFAGGLPPPFMGLQTASDYVMSVSAVSAWAPGSSR